MFPLLEAPFHLRGCMARGVPHGVVNPPRIDGKDGVAGSIPAASSTPKPQARPAAIAAVFVVVAAAGITGPAWLLVAGLSGHGFKDLWQH
jgi:hypothetical protein